MPEHETNYIAEDTSSLVERRDEIIRFGIWWLTALDGPAEEAWMRPISDELLHIFQTYRWELERGISGFDLTAGWLEVIERARFQSLLLTSELLDVCPEAGLKIGEHEVSFGKDARRLLREAFDQFFGTCTGAQTATV